MSSRTLRLRRCSRAPRKTSDVVRIDNDKRRRLPAGACIGIPIDYIAGYLGAAGIQAALIRRAKEGGSYHVRVNLARAAMFFMSLGTFDKNASAPAGEQHQILAPDTITAQTRYGELVRLAPPVKFSETKPNWQDPVLVVRGSSKAK